MSILLSYAFRECQSVSYSYGKIGWDKIRYDFEWDMIFLNIYIYISNFKVVYEYVILYLYLIYKMNKK